ncbi:hypothetical protein NIES4071_08330 [Calothrix sp. NIES-4071]|nr:hypothetical protein NIES4071_08330 [Calothrix sp. NIES-4071]BAZ55175.1 hypothetical protein NIES4105_08290 [Calothrix sp. NIES-4105]
MIHQLINNFSDKRARKYCRPFRTGTIALALTTMFLGAACTNNLEARRTEGENNVTAQEVADNTVQLVGKTVTVRSQPVRKISPTTFTVSDQQFFGSEPILVINATGSVAPLPENIDLQITGPVANLVVADVERQYGLDLDPNLLVEYENKPAIIAQSIALAPKPGEISSNPSAYYNKVIAVPAEVEKIVGQNSFTLDEDKLIGGQDLLVVNPNPKVPIRASERVVVTGVLRPLVVADIEREFGFNWDTGFERQLEVEYKNRPVLIAQSVYPSALERR